MAILAVSRKSLECRVLEEDTKPQNNQLEFYTEVEDEFVYAAKAYLFNVQVKIDNINKVDCIEEFLSNCELDWTAEYQARFK